MLLGYFLWLSESENSQLLTFPTSDFRFPTSSHLSSSGTPGRATSSKGGLLTVRIPAFCFHFSTFTRACHVFSVACHVFSVGHFRPPTSHFRLRVSRLHLSTVKNFRLLTSHFRFRVTSDFELLPTSSWFSQRRSAATARSACGRMDTPDVGLALLLHFFPFTPLPGLKLPTSDLPLPISSPSFTLFPFYTFPPPFSTFPPLHRTQLPTFVPSSEIQGIWKTSKDFRRRPFASNWRPQLTASTVPLCS